MVASPGQNSGGSEETGLASIFRFSLLERGLGVAFAEGEENPLCPSGRSLLGRGLGTLLRWQSAAESCWTWVQ